MSVVRKLMVIGKVVKKLAPKISLVEVQTNQLDPYLRMYFMRYNEYRADDGPHRTKVGDYVLIRAKEQPERLDILHEVSEVTVRAGQAIDPITKKRVVTDMTTVDFLEDIHHVNRVLPDFVDRQDSLKYSEKDILEGSPQSLRDKS